MTPNRWIFVAGLLALTACIGPKRRPVEHAPTILHVGGPPPGAGPTAGPPPAPAQDPSSPCTPAERLAQAHQEEDAAPSIRVVMLRAVDFPRGPVRPKPAEIDRQVEQLKRLMTEIGPSDPEYPEYLFRLGNSFLDRKAHFELEAATLGAQAQGARAERRGEEAKRLEQRQAKSLGQAEHASADALKVFAVLVTKLSFARYVRLDEALLLYAQQSGALGREAQMKETSMRLIREYPNSPTVPYAYLIFGDYYMKEEELDKAAQFYEKVATNFPDSPVQLHALERLAWCHLLGGEPGTAGGADKSLGEFVSVLERAPREGEAELVQDARRGVIEAYLRAGLPSRAWAFFEKLAESSRAAPGELPRMIDGLGRAYFREGMYLESRGMSAELLRRYPDDAGACEWQWRGFLGALGEGDSHQALQERVGLLRQRDRLAQSAASSSALDRCRDRIRDAERVMLGGEG